MLGLGLGVSKVSSLRSLAAKLLAKLKSRSTYYENNKDSKQVVQDLDTIEVLDKASILLTPTAYSDARVHSVKTYTGDNVYDDDIDEAVNGGTWTDNGDSTFTVTGAGSPSVGVGVRDVSASYLINGNTYSWTVDGSNVSLAVYDASFTLVASGTSPLYFTATATNRLYISPTDGVSATYSNVSIIDVSSDFDFDRASSATRINSDGLVQDMQSITDPELVLNGDFEELGDDLVVNGDFYNWTGDNPDGWTIQGSENGSNFVTESPSGKLKIVSDGSLIGIQQDILTVGKTYTITVDVDDITGNFYIRTGATGITVAPNRISTTGTLSFNSICSGDGSLFITRGSSGSYTIDNVSVQQVDPNDRWSLGAGWSMEDGELVGDGNMTASDTVNQAYNFTDGNTYKFSFEITERTQGSVFIREPFDGGSDAVGTVGTHTFNYVAGAANELRLRSDDNFTGKIDNISVKDITFSEDVDLARINYDSNGENGHILLEPTSTNLVGYSLPNDTNWSKGSNTTITENYAVSPDGTQNASKLVMPSGSGTYAYYEFTATSTTNHTLSFYAKNNGGDADVTMAFFMASQTQSITLTNEWQRFEFTTSITSGNTVQVGVDNITSVDMLIFGVQCEALPYATSYIPSLTGSTVTRAAETLTGSGNSTLINSTEGVLYAEIAALSTTEGSGNISLSDGTGDNRIYIYYFEDNAISVIYNINSTGAVINNFTLSDITSYTKIAARWGNSNFSVWINGTEVLDVAASNFTSNTLDLLNLAKPDGSGQLEGKCKALAVFDEALTDTELQNLTS